MKYLIVAAVLGAILFFLYLRLRPYINAARRVLGVFREARRMSAGQGTPNAARRKRTDAEERLVRCASCGTWLPASRALTLRRSASSAFCSHACMERSAASETTARAAGSRR